MKEEEPGHVKGGEEGVSEDAAFLRSLHIWPLGVGGYIRILQRNRTRRREGCVCVCVCVCTHTERERLILGIDSHDYGGADVSGSAACKLKNQESQWYHSVWKPGNGGATDGSSSSSPKAGKPGVQGQEKMSASAQAESKFSPPPPFCSTWILHRVDDVHLATVNFFPPPADSNANLFWKDPHRHAQK